jgi:predicted transposase YdaD
MNKKPANLAEIKILVVDDDEDVAHGRLLLKKNSS